MDVAAIGALEDVAARAVPANEFQDIGGSVARCSPGLATFKDAYRYVYLSREVSP